MLELCRFDTLIHLFVKMASELQGYIASVKNCTARKNGLQLATMLSLPLRSIPANVHQSVDKIKNLDVVSACENSINDSSIAGLAAFRLSALIALVHNDLEMAYKHELAAYNSMLDYFSGKDDDTTWIIPVLVRVSNDLRSVAEKADEKNNDINNKFLRESLNTLTRGFTSVAKDRTPVKQAGSKKLAIFAVTNVLFKIYFRVNTLQLCGKLINVVEGPGGIMDNLSLFPVCDVAMYKYYIGRLKMFEDRYEEARESLRFALRYCPASSVKNKQKILASLIPVEMCLGVLPGKGVEQYGLNELLALGDATRKGDIRQFEEIMLQHQGIFVKIGVFLVLEQVKIIAHRNLIKRIYVASNNNTRLNLGVIESVMKTMVRDIDLDEIECILSNLIFQGKIKGYISHQKSFLVLSKTDPFPTGAIVKKVK